MKLDFTERMSYQNRLAVSIAMTLDISKRWVLTLLPVLFFQVPAIAGLDGAQRRSVYDGTYKSCLLSASKSAPKVSQVEKHPWCTCYAEQVVDRVSPADVKSFAPPSGPSQKMISVANDAVLYCKKMLY